MKVLRVGDPHAKVGSLPEMRALILFVVEQAKFYKVDRIELLGDLFHTHNVVRLEVMEFWTWALDLLAQTCETVVLVGNHDQTGDYNSTFSALSLYALVKWPNLHIIEKPTRMGVFAYVPYTHNPDDFISAATSLGSAGAKVLVAHQTFTGSKYESGIYAPDGIPTDTWPLLFSHVISGHIHSEQSFGNFIYPGTARWDTVTDANRRKGIWLFDHEKDGIIKSIDFISTEKVCSPILSYEWREGTECPTWEPNARCAVELIGSSAWVAAEKEKLKGKCAIKTKITDTKKGVIRKTGNSFEHFMKELFTSPMDKGNLLKYAKEIGIV